MSPFELFNIFADNLLPIILIAGAGFVLGKTVVVEPRTVGRIVFYIFTPVLVFNLLLTSQLDLSQALTVVGFTASVIFIMGVIAFLFGKAFRLDRIHLLVVIVAVAFGNTGNYGLPLVKFAFGDEALAVASIFYVSTSILLNTVGVTLASLGRMNLKSALLGTLKIPVIYAVALALILRGLDVRLPLAFSRSIEIAASGAIPAMIVLLGLELSRIQWANSLRPIVLGVGIKLLIAPFAALLLAHLFGLSGPARQGGVIEAAMPAAVATTVVAAEYELDATLVTAIVFFGTLFSPLTLTPLIAFLSR
ncbi:MAG: AEC family transporter [Anaerolineales bacterium]|nr:AEC family transporter [Anaerolineales bacterium]